MALGPGIDTDWVTGEPTEPQFRARAAERQDLQRQKLERQVERANALARAMKLPEGGLLIEYVTNGLAKLIQGFVEKDPACQAYLHILEQAGHDIVVGQQAADALVRQNLRG